MEYADTVKVVRYIEDRLVEVMVGNDVVLLTIEEAKALGANIFTYKGKAMQLKQFVKLINRCYSSVGNIVRKNKYTTGEEVIEHYRNLDQQRESYIRLTYKGQPIQINEATEIIGINDTSLNKLLDKHPNIYTVEQIIEHYKKQGGPKKNPESKLTYQGQTISYKSTAELLNIGIKSIQNILKKYPEIKTVEQIIATYDKNGWPKHPESSTLTYKGETVSIKAAARMLGTSDSSLASLLSRHSDIYTVEQIIEYYSQKGGKHAANRLTYKGEAVGSKQAGEICNVSPSTINNLIKQYRFTTVEQIIEYYNKKDGHRYVRSGLTYNGNPVSVQYAAKIAGVSEYAMHNLKEKYKTVEEIIAYCKEIGKL